MLLSENWSKEDLENEKSYLELLNSRAPSDDAKDTGVFIQTTKAGHFQHVWGLCSRTFQAHHVVWSVEEPEGPGVMVVTEELCPQLISLTKCIG
jgi:hypothetical protein